MESYCFKLTLIPQSLWLEKYKKRRAHSDFQHFYDASKFHPLGEIENDCRICIISPIINAARLYIDLNFADSGRLSKSGQYAARKKEYQKSSVRCKVEHVFAVVKRLFGYRKTRYPGLRKQTYKNYIMFALANLYLADRKSLAVCFSVPL